MLAAVAHSQNPNDPLSCLELREVPMPVAPEGWTRVKVKASSLNMHDVWTLRGVGHDPKNIPIILGCDVAGVTDDGREVVVYPVIADPDAGNGDETLDPNRALLSERHDGGFAEYIVVPDRCVIPKPEQLSFEEAACLPVAWSTAYRMLFTQGQLKAGDRVLVQGAGGGVASAAIALAAAAGATVYATSRTADKRALALELGAHAAFESGDRLPERVDLVIETVGEATWGHSLRCLRPGGTLSSLGVYSGKLGIAYDAFNAGLGDHRIVTTLCPGGKERMRRLMSMVQSGRLDLTPMLTHTFSLDDIQEAYALFGDRRDGVIKVAVRP
jgi:NADPH:quinone reductase-like Zn-dependent oxidoreductase